MKIADWISERCEDFIQANCDNNSGDLAYNYGLKSGVEGFRKYLVHSILSGYDIFSEEHENEGCEK